MVVAKRVVARTSPSSFRSKLVAREGARWPLSKPQLAGNGSKPEPSVSRVADL